MKFLLFISIFISSLSFNSSVETANEFSFNDCPFTYEQGLEIGCQLARRANRQGCRVYGVCYERFAQNTVEDFQSECPEYARGVLEGFQNCFRSGTPTNNAHNGDPLDTGNNVIDPPCDDAVYVNGHWECP